MRSALWGDESEGEESHTVTLSTYPPSDGAVAGTAPEGTGCVFYELKEDVFQAAIAALAEDQFEPTTFADGLVEGAFYRLRKTERSLCRSLMKRGGRLPSTERSGSSSRYSAAV